MSRLSTKLLGRPSLTIHRFTGPKVNIQHAMLGREGNLIDGKADDGSSSGSQSGQGGLADDDGKKLNV